MGLFTGLAFLAMACGIFWLAHQVCRRRVCGLDRLEAEELIRGQGNLALALRFAGFPLVVALGLSGSLSAPSAGFWRDIAGFALSGAFLIGLSWLAWEVNERYILPKLDNRLEVLAGNTAVGLVEFGGGLASGLILRSAFSGSGSLLSGVVFFLLAQLGLVLFFRLLTLLTEYDDESELGQGNLALGLDLAGMLLCLGIVMAQAVSGDFRNWSSDILAFAMSCLRGMALLVGLSCLIDKLLFSACVRRGNLRYPSDMAFVAARLGLRLSLAVLIAATA